MKVLEKRGGGGAKAGGGVEGWGRCRGVRGGSLEVSTLARIIDSNTWRERYHAGGHAEEDSIIQGCEEGGAFKIMSVCVFFFFFFPSLFSQLDVFPSCS